MRPTLVLCCCYFGRAWDTLDVQWEPLDVQHAPWAVPRVPCGLPIKLGPTFHGRPHVSHGTSTVSNCMSEAPHGTTNGRKIRHVGRPMEKWDVQRDPRGKSNGVPLRLTPLDVQRVQWDVQRVPWDSNWTSNVSHGSSHMNSQ